MEERNPQMQDQLDYLTELRTQTQGLRDLSVPAFYATRVRNRYARTHIRQINLLAQQVLVELDYATMALEGGRDV